MSHYGLVKAQPIRLNEFKLDIRITSERRKSSRVWNSNKVHVTLCLIPIPAPSPSLEVSDYRLVLLIQSSQLIHIFYYAEDVSMAYMRGSATSALSCVFVIENFCLAVYTVGSHI